MTALTVPTIFTAVDKLSAVVSKMGKAVGGFSSTAGNAILRLNNKFNSFFKLGNLQKQLLSFASTAALVGLIVSGINFSVQSLLNYEQEVARLHGLMSGLSETGFKPYQAEIDKVAKATTYSSIEVAKAFQQIVKLNAGLAKTPQSMGMITTAAITLSRASGMELAPATEGLIGVMNMFGLQAKDTNRIINVLAAASRNGAGTVEDQIESYRKWGIVAKSANITLEQSAAINSVLGSFLQKGADSGTMLRTAIVRLQKAGAGYQSGQFQLNDALSQTLTFYNKLSSVRAKDTFLERLFGPRGMTAGRLLLQNAQRINDMTKSVTGTNDAFQQAAQNMNTVYGWLDKLKAAWVNYITSNSNAHKGLNAIKDVLRFIVIHLDGVVRGVEWAIGTFIVFKTVVGLVTAAFKLYDFYQAIAATSTAATATAMDTSAVSMAAAGTQLSLFATEATVAETAAAGLFATLSSFVIPAGLAALGGMVLWNWGKGVKKEWDYNAAQDALAKKNRYYSPTNTGAPFSNPSEESNYQRWWLQQVKAYPKVPEDAPAFQRDVFDKKFGSIFDTKSIFDPSLMSPNPALHSPAVQAQMVHSSATTQNNLSISIDDKRGLVRDTTQTGPFPIPVRLTPTTGQK